jgi:hypothetical protein
MANAIQLAKNYVPLLDEVYKLSSLTAVLESPAELARAGASAREILLPKMDLVGLGDYNRSTGYAVGDVTLSYQTHTFNFERGRKFSLDAMDNEETQGVLVGRLLGEYVRTKVVPELDAFRFAKFAAEAAAANATFGGYASENIANGVTAIAAIRAGVTKLDNNEVPPEGRFLFITPTLLGQIEDLKTDESRAALAGLTVVKVPQSRFYTSITQDAGATASAGGFTFTNNASSNINFMLVSNTAPVVFTKHLVSDILDPAVNPDADAWVLKYRSYGLAEVLENKIGGIYVSRENKLLTV